MELEQLRSLIMDFDAMGKVLRGGVPRSSGDIVIIGQKAIEVEAVATTLKVIAGEIPTSALFDRRDGTRRFIENWVKETSHS